MSQGLAERYEELERIDSELRRAELDLLAAHLNHRAGNGPRPEAVYLDVLCLRARSRELLVWLGDQLAAATIEGSGAVDERFKSHAWKACEG
jgi:hypothetical protein